MAAARLRVGDSPRVFGTPRSRCEAVGDELRVERGLSRSDSRFEKAGNAPRVGDTEPRVGDTPRRVGETPPRSLANQMCACL